ncbi:AAA family ATPase (plasmid) [Burkholderia vietnamiensis]|uniref:AAA family ATPase n=1 Tax=Burkholderia vietnamiensis TaxID=60552 RepID=UPI002018DA9D|nr:AAA family ATPase [Burkholderia vietnamiensis]MCO1348062.1 AAA family ATPase [Burkholderia vietnamiensis]MCO1430535.1 AAA family ATPase [Burkholderia vietnamiensis]UQN46426.1 AAA family ATPase [Burkholderia vietnamiensis]
MQAIEANSTGTGVILESARDIPMQSPREIWKDWLYVAKVHLLAGPPSTGKTTIAMTMAATISTGGLWPDGSCSPRGRVVIWSSEDGIEDTVIPRLVAAGADLSNIEVLRMTVENWSRRQFDPVRDLRLLEDKIRQLGDVALVIIDSIAELMPGSPGNNNKVRKSLLPLVGLAERTNCAVVGLTHVVKASKKKHPLERIIGGVGLGAVVRVAMLVARDDAGGFGAVREWNVLVKAKANICREDGGFLYCTAGMQIAAPYGLIESSRIQWGPPLPGSAMDILNRAESSEQGGAAGKFQQAGDFLMAELKDGPRLASEVEAKAAQVGISKSTLRRAREQCGVESQKQRGAGPASPYMWSLSPQSAAPGMASLRSTMDLGVSLPPLASGHLPKDYWHTPMPMAGAMTSGGAGYMPGGGAFVGHPGPAFGSSVPSALFSPGVDESGMNGSMHAAQPGQPGQPGQVGQVGQVGQHPEFAGVPQPAAAAEMGGGDRQVEPHHPQFESGVVVPMLGYVLDDAKHELQRRPRAADDDPAHYLADVIDSVIRGYDDFTQAEKRQLSEALWSELVPYVAGNR